MIKNNHKTIKLNKILNNPTLKLLEILEENPDRCVITLLGKVEVIGKDKFPNEKKFVLRLKKKEFNANNNIESLSKNLHSMINSPEQIFNNDIYYKIISSDFIENKLKIDLIYPACSKVIDKYRKKGFALIIESPEIYKSKTIPYIESIDPSHTKWIKNILYEKAEEILHEEKDKFVLVQDYNSKDNQNIVNCLGLPYLDNLRSIRDLNETHLELLELFYSRGREVIADKFNIGKDKIRCFVHYPPSFYYFHVHFLLVDFESNSTSINRAIDLHSVIQNIKMKSDYYKLIDLEINLQIGSKLYEILNNI